jgi:hypothetical protein
MDDKPISPGDETPSGNPPRGAGVDGPTSPGDTPHVVYEPLPASRRDIARQRRALRRAYHSRTMPSWVKKVPWIIFPMYGLARIRDPNYEKHVQQWQDEQRRNYKEGDSR